MESYHGDERLDPAQKEDSGSFGVRVQLQGINGRPCVVLGAQGKNVLEYPDVFLTEDQQQGLLSYMSGSASRIQTPPADSASPRKSPETLTHIPSLPYHTASRSGRVWLSSPVNASPVMVKRARVPLPGADREVENIPCRTSHIICRPASGDDLELRESPRLARLGHRSRMSPDDKRRSRSAECRFTVTPGVEMEVESSTDVRQQEVTGVRSAASTERSKVRGAEKSVEREAQAENIHTM